ncbi:MAG: TetR/AcrR family transcriptional regulator [Tepidanaerobacteraceae bacterium]|nr:TetR/AcrR family transcriptional regulator [Tepidanaerobacteraceae bacterium]
MNGFERRRERKSKCIRKVAFELFCTFGVRKTSIAKIAQKASVSQVTIYNYFGSKEGLLRECLAEYMDQKLQEYEKLMEEELPFPQIIEKIVFDKTETFKMMNREFIQAILLKNPTMQEIIEDFYEKKALPMMIKLIEKGRSEGYVNKNISMEAFLYYIKVFKEAAYGSEFLSDRSKQAQQDLASLFFYGLMGKPS